MSRELSTIEFSIFKLLYLASNAMFIGFWVVHVVILEHWSNIYFNWLISSLWSPFLLQICMFKPKHRCPGFIRCFISYQKIILYFSWISWITYINSLVIEYIIHNPSLFFWIQNKITIKVLVTFSSFLMFVSIIKWFHE